MEITINPNGTWYHGSNLKFSELKEGSTITQWRELAEAFSHQPTMLSYDDTGVINHNGLQKGYLYIIDEKIEIGKDICQHPKTTMDKNAEFLTKRPLAVRLIEEIEALPVDFCLSTTQIAFSEIARIVSNADEKVMLEVTECTTNTEQYFSRNKETYEERGVYSCDESIEIQWLGMVDILQKYNYVCERDWKDELADFSYFVKNLVTAQSANLPLEDSWLNEDGDVVAWCTILDEKWKTHGHCIGAFDIDSDSYVLFICSPADLERLSELAQTLEHRIAPAKEM